MRLPLSAAVERPSLTPRPKLVVCGLLLLFSLALLLAYAGDAKENPLPIPSIKWHLAKVIQGDKIRTLPSGFIARLDTVTRSRILGYSGVNSFSCEVVESAGQLRSKGPITTTRRAGRPPFAEMESLIQSAIQDAALVLEKSSITVKSGVVTLVFQAEPLAL